MNTIENNKLIAEFMGVESYEFRGYTMFVFEEDNHRPHIDLHYHKDWNWLMEVVEKIESLDIYYNNYIDYNSSIVSSGKIELSTNINFVYNQIIDFIKWYNEQN